MESETLSLSPQNPAICLHPELVHIHTTYLLKEH